MNDEEFNKEYIKAKQNCMMFKYADGHYIMFMYKNGELYQTSRTIEHYLTQNLIINQKKGTEQ